MIFGTWRSYFIRWQTFENKVWCPFLLFLAYSIDRLNWALFSVVILFQHLFPLSEKVEIRAFILPHNFPVLLITFTGRGIPPPSPQCGAGRGVHPWDKVCKLGHAKCTWFSLETSMTPKKSMTLDFVNLTLRVVQRYMVLAEHETDQWELRSLLQFLRCFRNMLLLNTL